MCVARTPPIFKKEMEILLYLTSVLNEVGFFPRGSSRSEETHDGKIQFGKHSGNRLAI